MLAPDVVLVSDGGGHKQAALRPILGRDKVPAGSPPSAGAGRRADVVTVNGAPAVTVLLDGELDTVVTLPVEDGRVTGLYVLRNPDKLGRLGEVTPLGR